MTETTDASGAAAGGDPDPGAYISPETLHTQLQTGAAPAVLDVRDADEYAVGHLPGARPLPGDELPRRLAEVPRGRPVVTY
jgi:rhodanese-related sulfurtransferase